MALKYGNRIKVAAAAAPSFGNFILGSAISGYQSFAAGIPSITTGDTVRYVIEDGSNWEIGTGTYNTTGPQIARTTVIQSSAGGTSLISASASAIIMVSVAASDFLPTDGGTVTGTVVLPSTTSIGTVSSTEIGYLDGVTSAVQTQLGQKFPLTETVFAISGTTPTILQSNGTIQTWTLTGASTLTSGLLDGQSVTLMIDDGAGYTVTWTSITWKTNSGSVPPLNLSGYTAVVLWKVGAVNYGARVGNA